MSGIGLRHRLEFLAFKLFSGLALGALVESEELESWELEIFSFVCKGVFFMMKRFSVIEY